MAPKPSPTQRARLTVPGLAGCAGTDEDLRLFLEVLKYATQVERERLKEAVIDSQMVADRLRLSIDDRVHRLMRVGHILDVEPWGGNVLFIDNGWRCVLSHQIRRFRGVESIEDYLNMRPNVSSSTEPEMAARESAKSEAELARPMTIFIVHGHDGETKYEVTRFVETKTDSAEVRVVILHEQPSKGRTIIEKFQDYADSASFAIVLLTPDDEGGPKGGPFNPRARQNVVFELAYFYAKLGRDHVAVILAGDVEKPSDVAGMQYIPFDGQWKHDLLEELREARIPLR